RTGRVGHTGRRQSRAGDRPLRRTTRMVGATGDGQSTHRATPSAAAPVLPGEPYRHPHPTWSHHLCDARELTRCCASVAVEGVAHAGEEAAGMFGQFGHLLAAGLGELAEDALLVGVEAGGGTHVEVHIQLAAAGTAQVGDALATDAEAG